MYTEWALRAKMSWLHHTGPTKLGLWTTWRKRGSSLGLRRTPIQEHGPCFLMEIGGIQHEDSCEALCSQLNGSVCRRNPAPCPPALKSCRESLLPRHWGAPWGHTLSCVLAPLSSWLVIHFIPMEPCPESHSIQWAVAQQGGCQTSTDLCVSSFLCKIAPLLRLGTSFSAKRHLPLLCQREDNAPVLPAPGAPASWSGPLLCPSATPAFEMNPELHHAVCFGHSS